MLEQMTDDFRQSICENLNTSLDQVQKDVQHLKSWIRSQPHLPQCSTNTVLTSFIIGCKNDIDVAKRKINNYYTARGRLPDFFSDRDPSNEALQAVSRDARFFYLPKMTPDGCRVQMMVFVSRSADNYNYPVFLKRTLMVEDVKIHREAFNNGTYVVVDLRNFSASHALKTTARGCKDIFQCMQNVIPTSIKRIIIINAPAFMTVLMAMVKPMMKKKVYQRFCLHSEGYEVLDRYLPRAMLPKDYGGGEESSEQLNESWMRCLEANRDWLMNEGSMKTDESKRDDAKPLTLGNIEEFSAKDIRPFKNLCID